MSRQSSLSLEGQQIDEQGSSQLQGQSIRQFKDRLARYSITLGGGLVLAALLMIFGYLLYVVEPIFRSAEVTPERQVALPEHRQVVALGSDELNQVGYHFDDQGLLSFYALGDEAMVLSEPASLPLPGGVATSSYSRTIADSRAIAYGLDNGQVIAAQPTFDVSYPDNVRTISTGVRYPLGEAPLDLDPQGQPLVNLAFQHNEEQYTVVARTRDGRVLMSQKIAEENFMTEEIEWVGEVTELFDTPETVEQLLLTPDQRLLFILGQNRLFIYDIADPEEISMREVVEVNAAHANVSAVALLSGGSSILVGNDNGEISQWFEVQGERGRRLQRIRGFEMDGAVTEITAEVYRKTFAAVSDSGQLKLFHTTSEADLVSYQLDTTKNEAITFTPRSNGLLVLNEQAVQFLAVENEHPEVTWSGLWQEVWYEGYPEPDYIWQSTSATDDFEPKLSLVPISFGTIKAALYAMLFATPLALAGAIYTAYFMPPALRTKIKPTVEIMEALPTVILGFLAGLWLAPVVEEELASIVLLLVFIPLAIVLFAFAHYKLPANWRERLNEEFSVLMLIPVVLAVGWLCFELGPVVEAAFMGGDSRQFITNELGIDFDQRNALVVGIAMGFAVIPTIFSIAEDAVFSVPSHLSNGSLALGATRWQTMMRVVLLTASPGIFSAVMMGLGRAVGETMIVLMATGNTPIMDWNIFEGMRTLSANIAVEMPESEVNSTHYRVLFLAAFVLFIFTFFFNTIAEFVRQRLREKYGSL